MRQGGKNSISYGLEVRKLKYSLKMSKFKTCPLCFCASTNFNRERLQIWFLLTSNPWTPVAGYGSCKAIPYKKISQSLTDKQNFMLYNIHKGKNWSFTVFEVFQIWPCNSAWLLFAKHENLACNLRKLNFYINNFKRLRYFFAWTPFLFMIRICTIYRPHKKATSYHRGNDKEVNDEKECLDIFS